MNAKTSADRELVQLAEIEAAREALPPWIRRTPILPLARTPDEIGRERLLLKCENLQVTGAYKPRAVCTVMQALSASARRRGIILTSSGNFAQAFAHVGRMMGVPVVVVMLETASPFKVEAARRMGAEVVFCRDRLERHPTVQRIAAERGLVAVDTWEEPEIVVGHGSIGLEILEDAPEVELVLVPVSSGGLAAGVAAAIKQRRPGIRVVGVQPERANAAYLSLERGAPTTIDHWDSIADGLSAVRPGAYPFRHLQRYLDGIVLVSETEIAAAFRILLERAKILAEPAGAVAAAAFLFAKVEATAPTVALVSGGNVTRETIDRMLAMPAPLAAM